MGSISFLHLADSHIGKHSKLMATDPTSGRNLMSLDVQQQLERSVELAISEHVDFVVHAGDLFDRVQVRTIDMDGAMEAIRRLGEAGIPFITIAGNHDRPFTRGVVSPIALLSHLPKCYPIPHHGTKSLAVGHDKVAIHGISFLNRMVDEEFQTLLAGLRGDQKSEYEIVLSHQTISGFNLGFELQQSNEPHITMDMFPNDVNYIALGHIHKRQTKRHPKNAELLLHYPGSPVIIDFDERDDMKAATLVHMDGKQAEIEDIPLTVRKTEEVVMQVSNPTSTWLEDRVNSLLETHADPDMMLGIRVKGQLNAVHRGLVNASHYNQYRKAYAGFNIYTNKLQWLGYANENYVEEQQWLHEPVEELKLLLEADEAIDARKRQMLLALGEEIIQEYRESI